ncbi:MAG: c-type cytochrome [Ginsengibacter sp.]
MAKNKKLILLLSVLLFSVCNAHAQTRKFPAPATADTIKNPLKGNDASIIAGKKTYIKFCVTCHGDKGKGDGIAAPGLAKPPADHTSAFVQGQTDGALFWIISAGNRPMPSYKTTLASNQRWQVINYIRTLKKSK